MASSINEELDKLRLIIENKKNKEIVIDILNKALNIELTDFKYQGIKALQKISEYDFSVLKIVGKVKNTEYEFYIKIIKGGEIKKSVFCCWSLLQEEYENNLEKTKEWKKIQNRIDKVSIKDNLNQEYKNSIHLALEGDFSYNFEVNFIELEKFLEKFEPELIKNVRNLNFSNKDILLVMVMEEKK